MFIPSDTHAKWSEVPNIPLLSGDLPGQWQAARSRHAKAFDASLESALNAVERYNMLCSENPPKLERFRDGLDELAKLDKSDGSDVSRYLKYRVELQTSHSFAGSRVHEALKSFSTMQSSDQNTSTAKDVLRTLNSWKSAISAGLDQHSSAVRAAGHWISMAKSMGKPLPQQGVEDSIPRKPSTGTLDSVYGLYAPPETPSYESRSSYSNSSDPLSVSSPPETLTHNTQQRTQQGYSDVTLPPSVYVQWETVYIAPPPGTPPYEAEQVLYPQSGTSARSSPNGYPDPQPHQDRGHRGYQR